MLLTSVNNTMFLTVTNPARAYFERAKTNEGIKRHEQFRMNLEGTIYVVEKWSPEKRS